MTQKEIRFMHMEVTLFFMMGITIGMEKTGEKIFMSAVTVPKI